MKKYFFTTLLALAFAFTTSAATTSNEESFDRIQLSQNELTELKSANNVITALPDESVEFIYLGSDFHLWTA